MNYIILNGIKSTLINGLLIQSLPPISKPLLRTQIEEIDGKDGDIVTSLGYSAYNKSFEIGLYGDYDIDEVINFFASAGTVTFSNEPDKYYRYQIFEQIDFERLVMFKTATVTIHVQPFKYSLVDNLKSFEIKNQLINFKGYQKTINGVTVTETEGVITVSGQSAADSEFYIMIDPLELPRGSYTLSAYASGTGVGACSIRLINNRPENLDSFGRSYLSLQNNTTVNLSSTLENFKFYRYIYCHITSGVTMNFTIDLRLQNDNYENPVIRNNGNTFSKPKMTIYGSGTINVGLGNSQIFIISLGNEGNITIDAEKMEAYKGNTLKNRLVVGDYENFVLKPGKNTINLTGSITKVDIENFSRWI